VSAVRTAVGIIGAGPAGLLLGHLLHLEGIDSVILEARSRAYCEGRIRAGVLEQGTRDLLIAAGLGERLLEESLRHEGIALRFGGRGHRIDLAALTGGRAVTVYGQHEVVKDLIAARLATGRPLLFEVEDVTLRALDGDRPRIRFRHEGSEHELSCAVIAGCDGFHGISRPSVPPGVLTVFERAYPFAWLGILAKAPPPSEELIYASHERGFALFSMRSPELGRLYVQCPPDADLADWPDERIWEELHARLGPNAPTLHEGRVLQKGIAPMRSFVVEPMRFGRLLLAGDSAHIVPPTGAKGMNLAVADVVQLTCAVRDFLATADEGPLERYSSACLGRIWQAQRFSWWMTSLLHRFDDHGPFDRRRQRADLEHVVTSTAAATALAESYVGQPID
jgi:p-hydroxybenzoate 3-monooxygenase